MLSRVGYSGSNQDWTSLSGNFEHFFAGTGEVTFAILVIRILFNQLCLQKLLNLILRSFQVITYVFFLILYFMYLLSSNLTNVGCVQWTSL
jgi:hypothetical protein